MQKYLKENINKDKLNDLYELAQKHQIPVDEQCPESIISMSVRLQSGKKIIAISPNSTYEDYESHTVSDYTKLECFAHEMGHCMTDSFYAGYSPFELRAKHENRANAWAVNRIVPFSDLCDAVKGGCRELWELAEYFGVSQSFIEKAIKIHERNGHIVPKELYEE